MFCAKCGNQIPDGSAFCEKCGNQAGAGAGVPAVPPPAAANKSNTLVILLVIGAVVVGLIFILGILAAIAIPNFLRATDKAHYNRCAQALSGLKVAEEMYISDKNVYASDIEKLGMYMIPGCTVADGCGTAVKDRINKNCKPDTVNIEVINQGTDYTIKANAMDHRSCAICVSPKGYIPVAYEQCSDSFQCP